jgi:hypothetical protein
MVYNNIKKFMETRNTTGVDAYTFNFDECHNTVIIPYGKRVYRDNIPPLLSSHPVIKNEEVDLSVAHTKTNLDNNFEEINNNSLKNDIKDTIETSNSTESIIV